MQRGVLAPHFSLALGGAGEVMPLVPLVLTGAQPAAGAGFTRIVPGNQWERLVGVTFKLVASAAVATRVPIVQFKDADGNEFLTVASIGTVVASGTITASFGIGCASSQSSQSSRVTTALPDLILYPALRWTLTATGLDVADQISAIAFYVQQFEVGTQQGISLGRKELEPDGSVRVWR